MPCCPCSSGPSAATMRAPEFWNRDGPAARLLDPLGRVYGFAGRMRQHLAHPWRAPIPVICVGNLVVGGTGKTPTALAVAGRLIERGHRPHLLTRGYRGRAKGPLMVDPARHDAGLVGDEALLLAGRAPTWVARDRPAGARAAAAAGASLLVLDDGFQDPALVHDLSLVVIDGETGFGNGRLLPAGPLREPVRRGLARASAVIRIGDDRCAIDRVIPDGLACLEADLVARPGAEAWRGRRVVAFAGIGRPEKFFRTLSGLGAEIVTTRAFADHHRYRTGEIDALLASAARHGATPITTAKDHVRLPAALRAHIGVLPVELIWRDLEALDQLLARVCCNRS
jgi:tetraacyldisaccharide 4'-kinase